MRGTQVNTAGRHPRGREEPPPGHGGGKTLLISYSFWVDRKEWLIWATAKSLWKEGEHKEIQLLDCGWITDAGVGEFGLHLGEWWGAVTVSEEGRSHHGSIPQGFELGFRKTTLSASTRARGPDSYPGPGQWSRPGMQKPKVGQ